MATETLRHDLGDGSTILVSGFDDDDVLASVEQQLRQSVNTPTPANGGDDRGGATRRATDAASVFGIQGLRTLALQSHELGDAIRTRRDELYRNEFPKLKPRFVAKCTACGTELDHDPGTCPDCGNTRLREPDPAEKRDAKELFESVNREGQSLRELAKYCEPDQWTAGVSLIIIQYEYVIAQNSGLYDDGDVISKEPQELLYGDPATIVPVVDEHNRVGGYWWTCPIHRSDPAREPGRCETCHAERREVYFTEQRRNDDHNRYYFRDEVVTWAYPQPRLNGLDGLAPTAEVVLRQVILDMMTRYGAAFYDQESDRLPNQLMVLHTTNADHWEEQIQKTRDEDDPYDSPILANEYSPRDGSTPELQVIDAMPDELLGQSDSLRKTYKEDIRQAIGISNVHDSDLQDAGGLNNEGLQLEVTDRSIASQQHDYIEGWLDTLAKRLGIEDWTISFLPDRGPSASEKQQRVKAGAAAANAGLDARWEDGDVEIDNGEFTPTAPSEETSDGPGADGSVDDPATASVAGDTSPSDATAGPAPAGASAKQAVDLLDDAFRHLLWTPSDADAEQQARAFWSEHEDVPSNVERHIRTAVAKTDLTMADGVSASTLQPFFTEKLTQPQGWSLDSLTDGLARDHDLDRTYARTVAESGVARILNQAKLDALAELEAETDQQVLYYWRGPSDSDTTDGCQQLKELTNPEYGGTPRPLAEFRDLQRQIHNEHFSGLEFDASALHPHERHTIEATLESAT